MAVSRGDRLAARAAEYEGVERTPKRGRVDSGSGLRPLHGETQTADEELRRKTRSPDIGGRATKRRDEEEAVQAEKDEGMARTKRKRVGSFEREGHAAASPIVTVKENSKVMDAKPESLVNETYRGVEHTPKRTRTLTGFSSANSLHKTPTANGSSNTPTAREDSPTSDLISLKATQEFLESPKTDPTKSRKRRLSGTFLQQLTTTTPTDTETPSPKPAPTTPTNGRPWMAFLNKYNSIVNAVRPKKRTRSDYEEDIDPLTATDSAPTPAKRRSTSPPVAFPSGASASESPNPTPARTPHRKRSMAPEPETPRVERAFWGERTAKKARAKGDDVESELEAKRAEFKKKQNEALKKFEGRG